MKKMLLGGGGALTAYAGVCVVAWNHWAWLQPMMPDACGVAAIILGAGLGTAALRDGKSAAKKVGKKMEGYEFELVPLNDAMRYKATLSDLGVASSSREPPSTSAFGSSESDEPKLNPALAKALKAAEVKEVEAAKAAKAAAAKELLAELTAALEDGSLGPRRLRQKLSPRVFVVDFDTSARPGRGGASPPRPPSMRELLEALREQVSFLLHIASPYDEVVLRVNSPGGPATDYGLAAAHFARLKQAGVSTTACVDLVAASGGYMLACTAERILAAPFSIVGSIGVIAAVPNVHRVLDKNGVEFVQRTAGAHKRTINVFTPNTPEGLQKFEDDLQIVHDAFIEHVTSNRPALVPDEVCTGETWLGANALKLGLVDAISTSDAYLRTRQLNAEVLLLKPKPPQRPQGIYALLNRVDAGLAALTHGTSSLLSALTAPLGWSPTWSGRHGQVGAAHAAAAQTGGVMPAFGGDEQSGLAAAAPSARAPLLEAGEGALAHEARRER